MKQSEITEQMLNDWKDNQRKVFASTPTSMNLINICLNAIDSGKHTDVIGFDNKLRTFMANEMARTGELHCEHCGSLMEVYYEPHCFHCKESKPKEKPSGRLQNNLFIAMKWLENNHDEFTQDGLWDELTDNEMIQGNDSFMEMHNCDSFLGENYKIFCENFETENVYWEVSW